MTWIAIWAALALMLGFWACIRIGKLEYRMQALEDKVAGYEQVEKEPVEPIAEAEATPQATGAFAVGGKPRAVPWRVRRAELEAAARTKRKALQEMRGE